MSQSRISDIMSRTVFDVHESDSLMQVVTLFETHHISGVPVKNDQGTYVGVLSKTDFVSRKLANLIAEKGNLDSISVKELMNPTPPISIHENQPLDDAIELMLEHHVHRVFVTDDDGQFTGIITTFDIVRFTRFTFEAYL